MMDEEKPQRRIRLVFLCSLVWGRVNLLTPKAALIVTLHELLLSD